MFKDRKEAGELLAEALSKYKDVESVVYALPRGGVAVALPVAQALHSPLDLIITRKIGHPLSPEYAVAAVAENGDMLGNEAELATIDKVWLEKAKEREQVEAKRRRELYLGGKAQVKVEGKVAILVDDGVATGLTMRAAILELRHREPKKIVVAVPVISEEAAAKIKNEADELIYLEPPERFGGAVGAHYETFEQVEDEEVASTIHNYGQRYEKEHKNKD